MLRALEQRYLYHPVPGAMGNWEYGWYRYVPGKHSDRVFFMCHGNMGNASQRLHWVGVFGAGHYYLHEYAGFGARHGQDELQREVIMKRAAEALKTIRAGPLYFIGESLGTGVVCELAVHYRPIGIFLLTPYSTMTAMAHRFVPLLGPLFLQDRYNTVHYLRQLQRLDHPPRLLVIAGWSDTIIPRSQIKQVAKAGGGSVAWYSGDHEDVFIEREQWLPLLEFFLHL